MAFKSFSALAVIATGIPVSLMGGIILLFLLGFKFSTDTDWLPTISPAVWWESHSDCKASLEKYNLDIYYRFLDYGNTSLNKRLKENLSIDKLTLDVFGGYLHQRGRYGMADLVDTVEWWLPTNNPLGRLDSFYKVTYDGPQIGLRAIGSYGKVTTRLSLAYVWLRTRAHGWWNMRKYAFWQTGDNSKGIDLKSEIIYNLNKNWFLGLGYNFAYLPQEKLEESGVYYTHPADNYDDLDIVRNVDNTLHGPLLKLGYAW